MYFYIICKYLHFSYKFTSFVIIVKSCRELFDEKEFTGKDQLDSFGIIYN